MHVDLSTEKVNVNGSLVDMTDANKVFEPFNKAVAFIKNILGWLLFVLATLICIGSCVTYRKEYKRSNPPKEIVTSAVVQTQVQAPSLPVGYQTFTVKQGEYSPKIVPQIPQGAERAFEVSHAPGRMVRYDGVEEVPWLSGTRLVLTPDVKFVQFSSKESYLVVKGIPYTDPQ